MLRIDQQINRDFMHLIRLCRRIRPGTCFLPQIPIPLAALFVAFACSNATAEPRPAWPPWPEPTLALYRFDDLEWRAWHRPPALGFDTAQVMESWSEYSLLRDGLSLSPVAIPTVDASGRQSFAPGAGAVRAWFCPHWSSVQAGGKGPGQYARLLELVSLDAKNLQTRWSLYVGELGEAIYLSGLDANGKAVDCLVAEAAFTAGEWQMITLCYSEKGSQLWLNGQLAAEGIGLGAPPPWQEASLGLVIGSDLAAGNPANGQFEEVATFDYWPDAAQQQLYFSGVSRQVFLGTVDSAAEEALKAELQEELFPQMSLMEEEGGGMIPLDYSHSAGELWLEITGASNQIAYLTLHGTEPLVAYEIQSTEDLTNAWAYETTVLGADGSDQTPFEVTMGERTNALFFRALSYADDDGDGLPGWWELEHGLDPNNPDTGGTGVSDGYKDGDGDGWSNLQEYENGTSPNGFNTPPAPQGFRVRLGAGGVDAVLGWLPANGPVQEYVVEKQLPDLTVYFTNTTASFVDAGVSLPTNPYWLEWTPAYRLKACYANGDSQWTLWKSIEEAINPTTVTVVGGSNGTRMMLAWDLPDDATIVRLHDAFGLTNVDVSVSQARWAIEPLPAWADPNGFGAAYYQQIIRTNGAATAIAFTVADSSGLGPFVDGREHLRQNLIFQLRSACASGPLRLDLGEGAKSLPADYVYAGFDLSMHFWSTASIWLPFRDHYLYRNLVFALEDLDTNAWLRTGLAYPDEDVFPLDWPYAYEFTNVGSYTPVPRLLGTNQATWLNPGWEDSSLGIRWAGNQFFLTNGVSNYYGLRFLSAKVVWAASPDPLVGMLLAGETLTDVLSNAVVEIYPETEQPELANAGWHFGIPGKDALPGDSGFSVSNTAPLLITSVGDPYFNIVGYAKLAILNGYSNMFGYLGQYFDKAYRTNPNGTRSTNETGFLSPYGYFFPTEPGRTILTTMRDGVSTSVGECTVHVIGLNVDANHDGVMDLSITGPDQTAEQRPFVFWVNGDRDEPGADGEPDEEVKARSGVPQDQDWYHGHIRCQRNLEDFTRLWVSGLDGLPENSGCTATLTFHAWGGAAPGIHLYRAYDTNGGPEYLTDTNAAAEQLRETYLNGQLMFDYARRIARLADGVSFELPMGPDGRPLYTRFLFEGTGAGVGQLVLTVRQDIDILAETSVWLDLRDVQEMYERVHVTKVKGGLPPSTMVSEMQLDCSPDVRPDEARQLIVFVHGINNTEFDVKWTGESMFKRLYWAGYDGRFATVRWPCAYLPKEGSVNPLELLKAFEYNKGEFFAFKSAAGLGAYLQDATNRLSGYTVNLYAHSQGVAVTSEAIRQGAPFDNCILTQGALPAHCYDTSTNVPFLQKFLDEEPTSPTPLDATNGGYHGCYASLPGNIVNFFNPQDYALATGKKMVLGQEIDTNWEANQVAYKPESFASGSLEYSYDPVTWKNLRTVRDEGETFVTEVTDPHETKAMIARTRTKALGALAGVGGVMNTNSAVDLQAVFGFGLTRDEHSAQFTRPIQSTKGYYDAVFDIIDAP